MKKLFAEFKEFIARGNVMDMAVGVIIATAFGKITTSLVNDVFMPFLGWIFGARDMTALNVVVRPAEVDAAGEVVQEAVVEDADKIFFILVALVVFAVVKALNKMKKKEEAPAEPEPEKPDPQLELLTEIRDLLKK